MMATLARLRVPLGFACGAAVLLLASPTRRSLALGGVLALAGEGFRFWAAGHLEKGREVTQSGPYRLTRHPLYVGSAIIASGAAVAAASWMVAAVIAGYMAVTLTAAIRTEEATMRAAFGEAYDRYLRSRPVAAPRPFSFARAMRNKEYRAVAGLLLVGIILAAKAAYR